MTTRIQFLRTLQFVLINLESFQEPRVQRIQIQVQHRELQQTLLIQHQQLIRQPQATQQQLTLHHPKQLTLHHHKQLTLHHLQQTPLYYLSILFL